MKKIIKTLLIIATVISTCMISSTIAFAGTSASNNGTGSGGSGNPDSGDVWKIGPNYSFGLAWDYHYGNVNWSTNLPFSERADQGGNRFSAPAQKWACIQKHTKTGAYTGWKNFRWAWWYGVAKHHDTPGGCVRNGYYNDIWYNDGYMDGSINDPDLVEAAANGGFHYNSYDLDYDNGSDRLDIVWNTAWQESSTDRASTIVYAYSDTGDVFLDDRSYESAESLYYNPTTSVPYHGISLDTELHHENRIHVTRMMVTRTETYKTDGERIWDYQVTYSKGARLNATKYLEYDVMQPSVEMAYFKPFDLNKNGVASDADVRATYRNYTGGSPLKISVDNKQNITNGKALQTLDTNITTPFSITINNDQFGIPKANQGGFDLENSAPGSGYSRGNGTYNPEIIDAVGYKSYEMTGIFDDDGYAQAINGDLSKDKYWSGSLKGGLSSNSASLTQGGVENLGKNVFTFNRGWQGGNFNFKTTKVGEYKLANGDREWWEILYEKGYFYRYGVEYSGMITLNSIQRANIDRDNLYARLASRNIVQPILKGIFEAKTVGGNLG